MSFQVYNTLTKQKEAFAPRESGLVRMYNCGPTVYNRQHIGNFRSFLFADTLRRWLEYSRYEVRQVMNLTDVGHLTDDERGEGEDKIEAQARREKKDPWKISAEQAALFLQDIRELGLRPAMVNPRASDHVPEMLAIIDVLIEKGHAYAMNGNVYFDVTTFPRYGRLSGNRIADLEAGARIEVREEKRHPEDFALWKSDPHHLMKWPSRFGEHGFPGWHIECTAMAFKHLGEELDIHTGGEDNIFPHHECEIAQSESASAKPFARYWMHAKFLQVDGGKMSKRLGNVYTLDDVKQKGFSVRALRYCLIRGHYRQPLNFTWEILKEATSALSDLDDLWGRLNAPDLHARPDRGSPHLDEAKREFETALDDDLNMPEAIAALHGLRNRTVRGEISGAAARVASEFMKRANDVLSVMNPPIYLSEVFSTSGTGQLGVDTGGKRTEKEAQRIQELMQQREIARHQRNWAESDRIRDELVRMGVQLRDTKKKG